MSSALLAKRLALLVGSVLMLMYVLGPVAWLLSSSLQREADITSIPPHWIPSPPTFSSFKAIIEGKHDDIPEQAFYLKGGIEDVLAAAEKMKQTA